MGAYPQPPLPPIVLNEWADLTFRSRSENELRSSITSGWMRGDLLLVRLSFVLLCIIPMEESLPTAICCPIPRHTESETLGDWDPPFPIDLKRIRPQDDTIGRNTALHRRVHPAHFCATLWQTRFGKLTSLRISPDRGQTLEQAHSGFERSLRETLDPLQDGFSILPVRAQGLEASRGATNFGEYFLYFSFFLVISALLLTALFFKLGVEQRLREIGTLQAIGFPASRVRKLFLLEGVILAVAGSLVGLVVRWRTVS